MSENQSQVGTVVSALKKIIKKKGLTYKDVALKLKLSEQTIKRFFTDDDVSLSRLADICELVDIPLNELFSAALKEKTPAYRLTVAQEEFLVEHPGLFGLYSKLAVGMKPQEIRRRFGISESTMRLVFARQHVFFRRPHALVNGQRNIFKCFSHIQKTIELEKQIQSLQGELARRGDGATL